ncbi:MAG: hypothetical protein [Bacteriophage sp.]|nr:MAG: hypothetical protein [Bacteriophage sp.]
MNVEINGVKYVPELPKVDLGALSVEFYCDDLNETLTVKEYLKRLLYTLWEEEDGFSGKRPFGNSCWQRYVIYSLIEEGYISGTIEYDENGYVRESNYNDQEAKEFVLGLIANL